MCHRFIKLFFSSVRVPAAMFKGNFYQAILPVALVFCSDLAESQCTRRYCQNHNEADLLAVCLRNQKVVEQLQQELTSLNVKHERLQREVKSTEERSQDGIRELNKKVARLEKSK